jgi:hypothetical protein
MENLNITMENAEVEFHNRPEMEGVQYLVHFPNKYGASIIRNSMSYGGRSGKWELAVTHEMVNGNWELCYRTDITDDVIGWLDDEEVYNLLVKISELPENPLCKHIARFWDEQEDNDAGRIH